MYMDISFGIEHPINQNGKIELTFSNCEISTPSWKFDNAVKTGSMQNYVYLDYLDYSIDQVNSDNKVILTFS